MTPERKVTAATIGAAVTTLLVGVLDRLHVDLTVAEQGAVTTLAVLACGWFVRSAR